MSRPLLEVPVESFEEALLAAQSGADRLELCSNLAQDGLTPFPETLARFAKAPPKSPTGGAIPFVVMIRPRTGDFCYTPAEITEMRAAITVAGNAGALGVVCGALTRANEIDRSACRALHAAAAGLQIVFHRAFDLIPDQFTALDQLVNLRFTRVLTSGRPGGAADPQNRAQLARLIARAANRIEILPAGGIRPHNLSALLTETGCAAIHSACRLRTPTGALGPLDPEIVRSLRSTLFA